MWKTTLVIARVLPHRVENNACINLCMYNSETYDTNYNISVLLLFFFFQQWVNSSAACVWCLMASKLKHWRWDCLHLLLDIKEVFDVKQFCLTSNTFPWCRNTFFCLCFKRLRNAYFAEKCKKHKIHQESLSSKSVWCQTFCLKLALICSVCMMLQMSWNNIKKWVAINFKRT